MQAAASHWTIRHRASGHQMSIQSPADDKNVQRQTVFRRQLSGY